MSDALLVSNAVLWIVVVVLALVVLALVRQIGVLHERLAPAGALSLRGGPRVGEAAPQLETQGLAGPVRVGGPSPDGRATLLFFLSPSCPVCKTLLPTVRSVARREGPRLVLASDGPLAEHEAFAREHGLQGLPYALSTELGVAFEVAKLPYAVLLDAAGVVRAKGIVNTREHLESLFEADALGVGSIQELLAADQERGGARRTG